MMVNNISRQFVAFQFPSVHIQSPLFYEMRRLCRTSHFHYPIWWAVSPLSRTMKRRVEALSANNLELLWGRRQSRASRGLRNLKQGHQMKSRYPGKGQIDYRSMRKTTTTMDAAWNISSTGAISTNDKLSSLRPLCVPPSLSLGWSRPGYLLANNGP